MVVENHQSLRENHRRSRSPCPTWPLYPS